ncbi:MAG: hypothetical protein GQ523_03860 [Methanophagales archaeon]|nr:hypothetical protein [Methanophagales archaeon]
MNMVVYSFYKEEERDEKMADKKKGREGLALILEEIAKAVDEDPNMWNLEEEYQRKYGTLTEEDMRKAFTI